MFDFDQRNVIIKRLKDNKIEDLNVKSRDGSTYELEAKFISYDYEEKTKTSGVPYSHYVRLIEILDNDNNYDKTIEKSDVYIYQNNIRKIVIHGTKDEIIYQQKVQLGRNIDINDYDIRISLNEETSVDIPNYELKQIGLARGRVRHSYISKDYPIIIDITEVTEEMDVFDEIKNRKKKNIRIKHEVEVEYHGLISQIQNFFDIIEEIFKLMKGTKNVYSNTTRSKISNEIGLLLNNKPTEKDTSRIKLQEKYTKISPKHLVKARNIKYRDLVYGGIVCNYSVKNKNVLAHKNEKGTNYYITYKADGVRKYLVIHETGIWLIYPDDEYNLVILPKDKKYSKIFNNYQNSVFDTELVNLKTNINDIEYFVLALDCLLFQGITVENESYQDRLQKCQILSKELNDSLLTFELKKVEVIRDDPKLFFPLIKEFYQKRESLNWNDDGFIFTPNNVIYNPRSQTISFKVINKTLNVLDNNNRYVEFTGSQTKKIYNIEVDSSFNNKVIEYRFDGNKLVPVKQGSKADRDFVAIKIWDDITSPEVSYNRSLMNTPDVCKWKHPNDLTIDFLIKIRSDNDNHKRMELYVFDVNQLVQFTGTDRYPLSQDNIKMNSPSLTLDETWNNKIIEFEWKKENDKIILQPRKYRQDKRNPNQKVIAEDVWEDIMDPIYIDDLAGETPKLVFKYHNQIKTKLYNQISEEYKRELHLLDIGSGRGGDINKWSKFNGKIIAVEPYETNRDELMKRINNSNIKDRITVLPLGGENTTEITSIVKEVIPEGKVDVISLMLSMSFFWSSDKHLDALVRTIVTNIKPGGKIIFLTINGDSLEEVFGSDIDTMNISGAKIHLYPEIGKYWGRPVDFELPRSIIEEGGQREYVVRLKEFTNKLSEYGFISEYILTAIENPELSLYNQKLLLSEDNLLYTSLYSYGSYVNIDGSKLREFDTDVELPKVPDPKLILTKQLDNLEVILQDVGHAINDDTYAPVNCKWFDGKIVRIATIDDNNKFFHCILKAFYPKYQNNNDAQFRIDLVKKVRNQLAGILDKGNPNYGNLEYQTHIYWETVDEGFYPKMVMKRIIDPQIIDYSLQGLIQLLKSSQALDKNIYRGIAEMLKVNIYFVKITRDDIELVIDRKYKIYDSRRPIIVISNNNEPLAIEVNGLFQTVFDDNDEFIKGLEERYPRSIQQYFNADETFINNFVEIFTTDNKFIFPEEIYEIYPDPEDPFRKSLDILYDVIIERTSNYQNK